MERILDNTEKIQRDIGKIQIDVKKNTLDLEHHIQRTDLLQEDLKVTKIKVNEIDTEMSKTKIIRDFLSSKFTLVLTALSVVLLLQKIFGFIPL